MEGSQDFEMALSDFDESVQGAIPIALGRGGEHIRGVAVTLTPFLEGHLAGSAGVTVVGDECHVTFAGPYARYQHYGLDFKHEKGQALYLEQPMVTEAQTVFDIMADTLGDAS